jgi:hypothetical protein
LPAAGGGGVALLYTAGSVLSVGFGSTVIDGDAKPLSCHTDGMHDDSCAVSATHVSSVSQHVEPVHPSPSCCVINNRLA